MAVVHFPEQLLNDTGGLRMLQVPAANYRDLVTAVADRFPALRHAIEVEMSVAIDGEIVFEPFIEPLRPDSEVHFLTRISGG